ncbi:MAG: hypothetical protein JNM10_10190 [Planctomycetia bacterium]|nr:hypothetical protein [Planctomycetia bacterium]
MPSATSIPLLGTRGPAAAAPLRRRPRGGALAIALALAPALVPALRDARKTGPSFGGPVRGAWAGPPATAPAAGDASRLVVLLAADTLDADIGESVATDLRQVRATLEAGVPAARLVVVERTGADVAPAALRAAIAALDVRPGDALLCYWAGHGAWADAGAYLRPRGEVLPRADLRAALLARGAGLTVLLTDCCGTYVGETFLFAPPRIDPDVFRDLFFRARGVVDVTAASRGEVAVGDRALGGVFTQALVRVLTGTPRETLDADRDGVVAWAEAVAALRTGTKDTLAMLHPRGLVVAGRPARGQTPHVFGDLAAPGPPIPAAPKRLGVRTEASKDGAKVVEVLADTPAAWMGLRAGEHVVEVRLLGADGGDDPRPVRAPDDLVAALRAAGPRGLVVLVLRDPAVPDPARRDREVPVRLGP